MKNGVSSQSPQASRVVSFYRIRSVGHRHKPWDTKMLGLVQSQRHTEGYVVQPSESGCFYLGLLFNQWLPESITSEFQSFDTEKVNPGERGIGGSHSRDQGVTGYPPFRGVSR